MCYNHIWLLNKWNPSKIYKTIMHPWNNGESCIMKEIGKPDCCLHFRPIVQVANISEEIFMEISRNHTCIETKAKLIWAVKYLQLEKCGEADKQQPQEARRWPWTRWLVAVLTIGSTRRQRWRSAPQGGGAEQWLQGKGAAPLARRWRSGTGSTASKVRRRQRWLAGLSTWWL